MDRFTAMQTFVRVAEAGSFTAVADQLNLARSAVTRQIAALEQHLGVKLIARSTRRLSLTAEGTAYLTQCRDILDRIEEAEGELAGRRGAAGGLIRASVPMSFGLRHLMPLIADYTVAHPDIRLELDFSDRRVDLIEEGFDFALRIATQLPETQVARRLSVCRSVVAAAPAYLKRHGIPQHPTELVRHQCLSYSLAIRSSWPFVIDGSVQQIEVSGRVTANNGDALQEAAIRGLGIIYEPTFLGADALRNGKLQAILTDFELPLFQMFAVFPGNRFVPQRVRNFVDFLAEKLGPDPYWDRDL
jgi:DNA-binding transcriptional LysR family regulator